MKKGDKRRGPFSASRRAASVDAAETADAGADHDAGFDLLLIGFGSPAGICESLGSGPHRVEDEIVDLALFLGLHPVVRIELALGGRAARHHGGNAAGKVVDLERVDRRDAAFTFEQPAPGRIGVTAQRSH